jgi:hypothetical protein
MENSLQDKIKYFTYGAQKFLNSTIDEPFWEIMSSDLKEKHLRAVALLHTITSIQKSNNITESMKMTAQISMNKIMEYKEELKGQVKVLRKIYNDIQYDPIHAEYADILSEEKEQLIVEYLLENAQYTVPLDIKSIKNALELKYDIFLDERDVAKTIDLVEYLVGSVGEAKNIAPKKL